MKILFFSRGRGRGHAIPDVSIAKELLQVKPDLSIRFISYAMGAETFRQFGYDVLDMGLPEANPFLETFTRSIAIMNEEEPSLIISHEEFCIPPAASIFGVPCLFLTDFFPPEGSLWMECLSYASNLILMDDPGYRDEPLGLQGKVKYVGPVLREMLVSKADRRTERERLGFLENALVVLILPGGSSASSEDSAPIFRLVDEAVEILGGISLTVWVVNADEEEKIRSVGPIKANTIFMRPHLDIERTMVASDIVITKATRITGLEFGALGVPSVSISYGLNPVDDQRVSQIRTNRALRARGLSGASLANHIREVLDNLSGTAVSDNWTRGRIGVIAEIKRQIELLRSGSGDGASR